MITICVNLAPKLLLNIYEASHGFFILEIRGIDETHIFLILQVDLKLVLPWDVPIEVVQYLVIFDRFAISHVLDLSIVYLTLLLEWSHRLLTFLFLICIRLKPLLILRSQSLCLFSLLCLLFIVCTIDLHPILFDRLHLNGVPLDEATSDENIVVLHLEKVAAGLS